MGYPWHSVLSRWAASWLVMGCLLPATYGAEAPTTNQVVRETAPREPARPSSPATPTPATAAPADNLDAVEKEYRSIMIADDAAQDDVDRMLQENQAFAAKGAGLPEAELRRRAREKLEGVRKSYEDFLKRHPAHARAHVAFAAFLGDLGEEDAAQEHLERALTLNPKDPAIHNNLANVYAHIGRLKKSFELYTKAIELSPTEAVYYHNFGTTLFMFRKDAQEYYHLDEAQVCEKALTLYSNAVRLAPEDFPLASDVAQTFYGIQPFPIERALVAWTNAFHTAQDDVERQGVHVHFARIKLLAGRLAEARAHLELVKDATYAELKQRILRNLEELTKIARNGTTNRAAATNMAVAPKPTPAPVPATNAPAPPKVAATPATNAPVPAKVTVTLPATNPPPATAATTPPLPPPPAAPATNAPTAATNQPPKAASPAPAQTSPLPPPDKKG